MSRPLRIEFECAVYHVTSRGNARQIIYEDDSDRHRFLELLGHEIHQQRWVCYAYCLMDNHYHLVIETPDANLSCGMARLNAVYAQWFNRRHLRVGHLFQGRYKAILVEKESYLLELCRYVVLNPVRAGLVEHVDQWKWSSYLATAYGGNPPSWLSTGWILSQFGTNKVQAQRTYRKFVAEGSGEPSPWEKLRGQIYLGKEKFLKEMSQRIKGIPREQVSEEVMRPDRPRMEQICTAVADAAGVPQETVLDRQDRRDVFQVMVYLLRRACNLPIKEVAALGKVSVPRISQIQQRIEDSGGLGHAFQWAEKLEKYIK
ncbi:MAG: transposase [Deltaproteobacteria bacterium]|nr:transposase [Deltaproteobacteria bacterium]